MLLFVVLIHRLVRTVNIKPLKNTRRLVNGGGGGGGGQKLDWVEVLYWWHFCSVTISLHEGQ